MGVADFKVFDLPEPERDRLVVMLASFFRARPGVRLAFLFGPFVAGRPFRWVEVGVEWTPGVGDPDRAAALLERALSHTYSLRWRVVDLRGAGPLTLWQAASGLLIHTLDPDRAVDVCRRAWPAGWDFLPKLRRWLQPTS